MNLQKFKRIPVKVFDMYDDEVGTFQSIALASLHTKDSQSSIKQKIESGEMSKNGYYYQNVK